MFNQFQLFNSHNKFVLNRTFREYFIEHSVCEREEVCMCENMCLAQLKDTRVFLVHFPRYGRIDTENVAATEFDKLLSLPESTTPFQNKRKKIAIVYGRSAWKKKKMTEKRRVQWYRIPLTMPHLFQVHYLNCSFFLFDSIFTFFFSILFFTFEEFSYHMLSTLFYSFEKLVQNYVNRI